MLLVREQTLSNRSGVLRDGRHSRQARSFTAMDAMLFIMMVALIIAGARL